jgi:hypothetical protein
MLLNAAVVCKYVHNLLKYFRKVVNREIGLYFAILVLSPFFYSGFTSEILRQSCKMPVCSE